MFAFSTRHDAMQFCCDHNRDKAMETACCVVDGPADNEWTVMSIVDAFEFDFAFTVPDPLTP